MMKRLKDLDLTQGRDRHAFLLIVHQDTFESDSLSGVFVEGLVNLTTNRKMSIYDQISSEIHPYPNVPSPSLLMTS